MSFLVSLQNPPEAAVYWTPVFYVRDPDTGTFTPYYPPANLDIGQDWLVPISAGQGILVNFTAIVYDVNNEILDSRDENNVVVRDNEAFVYDWGITAGGGLNPWVVAVPLAAIGAVALSRTLRRR